MKAGTPFNIPDGDGGRAKSTKLEAAQRVEHQRNDIFPSLWSCADLLGSFPVPALHSHDDDSNRAAQP